MYHKIISLPLSITISRKSNYHQLIITNQRILLGRKFLCNSQKSPSSSDLAQSPQSLLSSLVHRVSHNLSKDSHSIRHAIQLLNVPVKQIEHIRLISEVYPAGAKRGTSVPFLRARNFSTRKNRSWTENATGENRPPFVMFTAQYSRGREHIDRTPPSLALRARFLFHVPKMQLSNTTTAVQTGSTRYPSSLN